MLTCLNLTYLNFRARLDWRERKGEWRGVDPPLLIPNYDHRSQLAPPLTQIHHHQTWISTTLLKLDPSPTNPKIIFQPQTQTYFEPLNNPNPYPITDWRKRDWMGESKSLMVFKQRKLLFKHHNMHFYTLFHLYIFPQNLNNVTRNLLPNGP